MKEKCKRITLIALGVVLAAGVADAALVGHWELDGDATDSAGASDGTLQGDPVYVTGKVGNALEFDGNGDYVTIPNEATFDITAAISVSCWIKVNVFDTQWQAIVTKGDNAWRLHRYADSSVINFANTGGSAGGNGDVSGTVNVNDGQWHHIVGVYDGSEVALYVDGRLDASLPSTGAIDTNNYAVCIGENAQQDERYFNGLIDDVRIYDHGLGETEIISLVLAVPRQVFIRSSEYFVEVGDSLTLSVAHVLVAGTPSYQWKKNGGELEDEEAATLVLDEVTLGALGNSGSYTCVITHEGPVSVEETEPYILEVLPEGSVPVAGLLGLAVLAGLSVLGGAAAIMRRKK